jgi:hypothetical protein
MGQAQQADDLVMMFADAAWRLRLRLAFEGRRAAICTISDSFTVCPTDGPPVSI